jgi:hypothetical protein
MAICTLAAVVAAFLVARSGRKQTERIAREGWNEARAIAKEDRTALSRPVVTLNIEESHTRSGLSAFDWLLSNVGAGVALHVCSGLKSGQLERIRSKTEVAYDARLDPLLCGEDKDYCIGIQDSVKVAEQVSALSTRELREGNYRLIITYEDTYGNRYETYYEKGVNTIPKT